MEKNIPKMKLGNVDDLFKTQKTRDDEDLEKVFDIKITDIDDFPNHPFKVIDNEDMEKMRDSIKENEVLVPALVRKKANGRYELISGHRRKRASELANKKTLPCIVRDLTDDEAIIIMVDSNIQREEILPSEKAFAYKMKLEALNHQGKNTSRQDGEKLLSVDVIGKEQNDSGRTVQRYIRLTKLIPELLELVDNKKIAFLPAVEISYLTDEEQYILLDCIEYNDATPSHAQAIRLKKLSQTGRLDNDTIEDILEEEKPNQIPKMRFDESRIRNVLPSNIEEEKIEDFVVDAIKFYDRHLHKQKQMGSR